MPTSDQDRTNELAASLDPMDQSLGVQFYETPDFLCERAADFLAEGSRNGESLLIVAVAAHAAAIARRLDERGVDTDVSGGAGRVTFLDARATLSELMIGPSPSWERFAEVVGGALRSAAARSSNGGVRAYGEMVDLLRTEGNTTAAVQLEQMWNRLRQSHTFSLLFGYSLSRPFAPGEIEKIRALHPEAPPVGGSGGAPDRDAVARLKKLANEIGRRNVIEATLRDSIRDLRRTEAALRRSQKETERLARVAGAIADAVTPEQISEAIVDEVALTVGASSAALWTISGGVARLVRSVGYSDASKKAFTDLPLDSTGRVPIVDVLLSGAPIWIESQEELVTRYPELAERVTPTRAYRIGCLPLSIQGETFGVLGFTFDDAPPLDQDAKRFLNIVARHSGQALERLRLLEADHQARARVDLLYKLAAQVIQSNGVDEVLDGALDAIQQALNTNRSSVLLFDSDGIMRFKAHRGLSSDYRGAVEGHSPWTREERDPPPILVSDVERDERLAAFVPVFRTEGIRALAFFPLVADGRLHGKFMVYFDACRELSCREVDMVRAIANHAASAVARFSALAELEETVRFNQVFTAILGHDLRNPLAAIMSSAQVAEKRDSQGALAKPLARILKSGSRMARMIDQLLDFTRVRVGAGIPLQRRPLDLVKLLQTTIEELEGALPGASFDFAAEGDANGVWDWDRLCQVFSNLLGNATEHGSKEESVRVRIDTPSSDRIRVLVHNVGAIPRDLLPRIFDPLVDAGLRRERSSGLGLGLYISREITKAHGGSIEVRSTEAEGTTFIVSLPRSASQRPPAVAP